MSMNFNEEFRFGSASWADESDVRDAGLFRPHGPQIGYLDNRAMHLEGDAPMITIGGAGSGKLRDLLGYVVCGSPGQRMLVLDPRGELGAISIHTHASHGDHAYFWNPMGILDLPQHRCNPLDILRLDALSFHADCKFVAESLIPTSGSSSGKYFELRARDWLEDIMKVLVESDGRVGLPVLARTINVIETDPARWANVLEAMLASRFEGVRRVACEMLTKQRDSPKEFGAILGEIYAYLGFLDDPALLQALDGEDLSLSTLCGTEQCAKLFLNIPAEYLSLWSPVIRLFFTVAILYKSRRPAGPKLMLLVDEAGQLGKFEALLRAFTYGRGAGVRAWSIFQDAGQIIRNFGAPALQGFLGSAQMRQFLGIRDFQTAQLVSNMLGNETLSYDDPMQQDNARRQKWEAVHQFVNGGDPFSAAYDIRHYDRQSENRTKQSRRLMTPDEILAMSEDRQILFISGKNIDPIFGYKYPYFARPEMAGRYLPNPYHPPITDVPITTGYGRVKRVPVIRERVPKKFSSFPQYQGGEWAYVSGYKPT